MWRPRNSRSSWKFFGCARNVGRAEIMFAVRIVFFRELIEAADLFTDGNLRLQKQKADQLQEIDSPPEWQNKGMFQPKNWCSTRDTVY
jgi:hypothetical protein